MSTNTTSADTRRIVVGVDGSELGNEALRWAARLAPTLGATIEVVSVWELPMSRASRGAVPVHYLELEKSSADTVAQSVREVFGETPPAGLVTTVKQGRPASVLVDAAQDAAMLIVGSRGLGGFVGLLLGSISRQVAEHATCPVLVVH